MRRSAPSPTWPARRARRPIPNCCDNSSVPAKRGVGLFEQALGEQRRINEQLVSRALEPVTRMASVLQELAAGCASNDALRGAGDSLVCAADVIDAHAAIIGRATAAVGAPLDLASRGLANERQAPASGQ